MTPFQVELLLIAGAAIVVGPFAYRGGKAFARTRGSRRFDAISRLVEFFSFLSIVVFFFLLFGIGDQAFELPSAVLGPWAFAAGYRNGRGLSRPRYRLE